MSFNATFLVSIISFVLFVFIMNRIFYAPLTKIIDDREQYIKNILKDADDIQNKADVIIQNRTEKLNKVAEENKDFLTKSIEEAKLKAKNTSDTSRRNFLDRFDRKKAKLEAESDLVKKELDAKVQELAKTIQEKILGL